jgi:Ca2+-binding RTX toxin-like protein
LAGADGLIVNNGSVSAAIQTGLGGLGIYIASAAGSHNQLVNDGTVSGLSYAVASGDGDETVVNRGAMNGEVLLGLGRDYLRNAGQVFGEVDLGGGGDRFKGWGGTVDGDIHGSGGNDTIIGGAADDAIFGDFGMDVLKGGNGDDTLAGGAGRDAMTGGLGSDTFDFNNVNESALGGQRDRITDFSKVDDFIDLSSIDANAGVGGNQAFDFIGSTAFSNTAGELRATTSSGNTIIAGDADGDGNADFSILAVGVTGLTAGDFIL